MDFNQIAISILLPAVISVVVAIVNNRRLKRLEFNYDYRKYILDKRKEAYNKIEDIMNGFQNVHTKAGGIIQKFYDVPDDAKTGDPNPLAMFNDVVVEAIRHSMWMSTNMVALLELLNTEFTKQLNEVRDKGITRSNLIEIGLRENHFLLRIHGVFFDTYLYDLMHLDDIDAFRDEKQRESVPTIQQARIYIRTQIEKKKPHHS